MELLTVLDSYQAEALQSIQSCQDANTLEEARIHFLGKKKGRLKDLQTELSKATPEQRPAIGKRFNEVKQAVEQAWEARKQELSVPRAQREGFDITLPGTQRLLGRRHPITQTITEFKEIAGRLGFAVAEGPEVEDDYHNFVALNIPEEHPARDPLGAHDTALLLARLARHRGVLVVNDPEGLMRARSKLYLAELAPRFRPETMVSRNPEQLSRFVRSRAQPTVVKPLAGSRGRDVFIVDGSSRNLRGMADVVTRQDYGVAQSFVPGAEQGDTRVVVLEGNILEHGGFPAAIRRVPASDDFRSNLHAGGRAEPAVISDGQRAAITSLAPLMRRDGLFLVGVDFIGETIIEINVFATGGLRDAERFSGVDFCEVILAALQHRVETTR